MCRIQEEAEPKASEICSALKDTEAVVRLNCIYKASLPVAYSFHLVLNSLHVDGSYCSIHSVFCVLGDHG